jgi:hypothetical protein
MGRETYFETESAHDDRLGEMNFGIAVRRGPQAGLVEELQSITSGNTEMAQRDCQTYIIMTYFNKHEAYESYHQRMQGSS